MAKAPDRDPDRQFDGVVLLTLLTLLLFASPLVHWWATGHSPWYLPFLLWLAPIAVGAWMQIRRKRHDL